MLFGAHVEIEIRLYVRGGTNYAWYSMSRLPRFSDMDFISFKGAVEFDSWAERMRRNLFVGVHSIFLGVSQLIMLNKYTKRHNSVLYPEWTEMRVESYTSFVSSFYILKQPTILIPPTSFFCFYYLLIKDRELVRTMHTLKHFVMEKRF